MPKKKNDEAKPATVNENKPEQTSALGWLNQLFSRTKGLCKDRNGNAIYKFTADKALLREALDNPANTWIGRDGQEKVDMMAFQVKGSYVIKEQQPRDTQN